MLLPASTAVGRGCRRHQDFFLSLYGKWKEKEEALWPPSLFVTAARSFRSEAALDALRRAAVHGVSPPPAGGDGVGGGGGVRRGDVVDTASASENGDGTGGYSLVLYNYPSLTGAMAALFARLYHSACQIPALLLPFSSVEPFRKIL